MDKTKLDIKIVFKPGGVSEWVTWYDCHDFKISNDASDNIITFWNNNEDKEKVEKIIPFDVVERIYKIHTKIGD